MSSVCRASMAALEQKAAVASSNVSARASSAGAVRMLHTRHLDTSAAIFAAFYLILRLPKCGASASAVRLTKTTFFPHRVAILETVNTSKFVVKL